MEQLNSFDGEIEVMKAEEFFSSSDPECPLHHYDLQAYEGESMVLQEFNNPSVTFDTGGSVLKVKTDKPLDIEFFIKASTLFDVSNS